MSESIKGVKTVKERNLMHYRIITFDLTTAHNNVEWDLEKVVEEYCELKILRSDSDFNFRLNCKDSDLIPIIAGDQTTFLNFKFDKIYFTNDAGEGNAVLWLASRLD